MDDLISRQAAIDALEREKTYSRAYNEGYTQTDPFEQYNMGLIDGIKALKRLPSAQPEIIRCEDCRWWKRESICEGHCLEIDLHHVDEDHYCSFAERRTDG